MARLKYIDFEWSLDVVGTDGNGKVITLENVSYEEKIELIEHIIREIGKGQDNGVFTHLIMTTEAKKYKEEK
jgi:hypothetical protein